MPRYSFKVKSKIGFTKRGLKFYENMQRHREILRKALKEAMYVTILIAIHARFRERRTDMATYERMDPYPTLSERNDLVQEALDQAHTRRNDMFELVMGLITSYNAITMVDDVDSISAKTGPIALLDSIKSPSATEIILGHYSTSPYDILWRQMEFGMGVYRKAGPWVITPTPYTSSRGGWWYGRKVPGEGVPFAGTHPGSFLRDAANLPYTQDFADFQATFRRRFRELLRS